MSESRSRLGLVTGATGHVGGRVVAELIERGWRVRVLSRSAAKVRGLDWGNHVVAEGESAGPGQVEVVEGNADAAQDVARALESVDVAWYLLHSMGASSDFAQEEREMAQVFAREGEKAGISRFVYLGGLHPDGELSEHLASRVEVGRVLLDSSVPTAALQAGLVVGDGSSSFAMMRHLSERLPGAVAPRWVRNRIQPIAIADAVHYLVASADLGSEVNRAFDIGGPKAYEYASLLKEYAQATGLPGRVVLTAPVTTPQLGAHWVGLVTPVESTLATPLIGSLLHDTVVHERDIDDLVGPPPGGHTPLRAAIRSAVEGKDTRRWRRTLASTVAAVTVTAVVGGMATDPTTWWYRSLRKPAWEPPGWAFPVAWTALYADIAVVSALSLADLGEKEQAAQQRSYAIALGANLALNAGWCVLFFAQRRPVLATVEAVALAASSADLVRRSHAVSKEKGIALAPYAAWTTFAAALCGSIARRNRRWPLR
ncbi:tryptophan-rich sensory protein [Demetria terragena]|uniref:tryptophan-rich sensory protein n=1 Tax=Demetria terragena TaxID=63959 RepID=UPI00037721CB|nr:tryptophan-rich sensory protein [Demetria terragena]